MVNTAVIVAAGRGKRMGGEVDKLFLNVSGLPVVGHTWRRFDTAPDIDEVVLVVREGTEEKFNALADSLSLAKPWRLASGGVERQDSVWNGLEASSAESELVAIQDGARPCTSQEIIAATLAAARETGAAVAARKVTDTLKEEDDAGVIAKTVDRARLWAVQTPQAFQRQVIVRALREVRDRGLHVTDDTAACELIGQQVRLVADEAANPKVTMSGDLEYIASLLAG